MSSTDSLAEIRGALLPDMDFSTAQALLRRYKALMGQEGHGKPEVRIAVVGGYNTVSLAPLIELYLFGAGISSMALDAGYGLFRQLILDTRSSLYSFKPKVVFIATGWRDISHLPGLDGGPDADECSHQEMEDWLSLWRVLHERAGCTIIQNNFDSPSWRILGNHEGRHPSGLARMLMHLNLELLTRAPPYVIIHDVDALSALRGRHTWNDARLYHYAKMPCGSQYLPEYAHSVASLIAAQEGRSRKCLVLDLDNTLWGGIIGEDGVEGIRIGQGDPEGEAFTAFQCYVRDLRRRGVLLAVCSKNDEAIAREAFERHPEMVLRMTDFACFMANWNDKAANLRAIAHHLNIGLDSLVFVDDSPGERALVRSLLPEVAVPEMPDDPAEYIQAVEKHRYFQLVALADEDLKRTEYYHADASRAAAASSAGSLHEYLASLRMKARVSPITKGTLERCVQLINRSNQFNLTTRRIAAAEVDARMEDESWVTLTVSLSDRFGENGLISILMARVERTELVIDTWVMSCRVVQRTVEHFLMNELCAAAKARGITSIRGEYIPTPKNALVCDHYQEMGFTKIESDAVGHSWWAVEVSHNPPALKTFVRKEEQE